MANLNPISREKKRKKVRMYNRASSLTANTEAVVKEIIEETQNSSKESLSRMDKLIEEAKKMA
jgi:ribosomal protein L17